MITDGTHAMKSDTWESLWNCTCEQKYTIEKDKDFYVLYLGRCSHLHGHNLVYLNDPAHNFDPELLEKLLNLGQQALEKEHKMKGKMITADEARALSGPSVEEYVEAACESIRNAATEKKNMISLMGDFWCRGGYDNTESYKQATKMLEDLGFKVEFFYEELQFVNMYTIVKW